jgi:DNA mismatch endonuclease (patch repair protein)
MPDVFTKAERSAVMSRIRGRGNKATELALMKLFRRHRISGWRRQQPVFGKPDFIFRRERVALFVDGCFWHGCPRCYCRPKSNRKFWDTKIARNRERDRKVSRELRRLGWRVIRIWEHDVAKQSDPCAKKLRAALKVSHSAFV